MHNTKVRLTIQQACNYVHANENNTILSLLIGINGRLLIEMVSAADTKTYYTDAVYSKEMVHVRKAHS